MKSYPRNALLAGAALPRHSAPRKTLDMHGLLANAIGHAAELSDTPEKWQATIAMLKQNGVDPSGFEDFKLGRPAAMAAAGLPAPRDCEAD